MGEQTLQGLNIRHLLSPTISRRLGNVVFLFCRHRLAANSVCNQSWTGSTAFTGASSEKSGHLGSSSRENLKLRNNFTSLNGEN